MRLWPFRGFSTFRARVFWSVIPIVLSLSVLYGLIDLRERQGLVEEEFLKRGQAMGANLADSSRLAVFSENEPMLESSIRGVVGDPDVAYVLVYGERGRVLVTGGRRLDERKGPSVHLSPDDTARLFTQGKPAMRITSIGKERFAEFLVPIVSEEVTLADELLIGPLAHAADAAGPGAPRVIGAVKLSMSLRGVEEHGAALLRLWASVTAAVLLVSTMVIYHLSRRITLPIKRVTVQAQKIAEGFLDQKIAVESRDEVGQLAGAFNEMASALKSNIQEKEDVLAELQDLNRTLEERIKQRTAEIEKRTEELERSLAEVRALGAVSQAVSSSLDLREVLETVARYAVNLSDSNGCGIFELDLERGTIEVVASHNLSESFLQEVQSSRIDRLQRRAIRSGLVARPVQIPDLEQATHFQLSSITLKHGFRALLIVPMEHGAVNRGVVLFRTSPGPFDESILNLLTALASQSKVAIDNARLFRELESQRHELERLSRNLEQLYRLSTSIQEPLSLKEQLHRVLDAARQVVGIDRFYIWVAKDDRLEALTGAGFAEEDWNFLGGAQIPLSAAGAMQKVYREGIPLLFDEAHPVPDELRLKPPYCDIKLLRSSSFLVVPMIARGRTMGVLTADNKISRKPIQPHTSELLRIFASHAAVAFENARLFHELEDRGHQLEVASRHKSQFLANMSHELRTPLNAILGYIELILDGIFGEVPDDIRDSLERAQTSGHHLLGLINDVLDLSKIEAGQLSLSITEYSMNDVVQAVVMAMQSLATEKQLALTAAVAPDLPAGEGDVRRITQVLTNLVGNAIKFTESGEVRVQVTASDDSFVVSVSDSGPGVAESDQRRIFEEFHQVDSSSTRKKGGTGLGLSIARRIVELHGGRIGVHSSIGEGSTFWFTLPVRVEEHKEAA
ncbi:MAG TPA: ATP-binding protein [Burkholderiales bacterium]|nr:ATP-binding protein [Burkholderiales bacterium]